MKKPSKKRVYSIIITLVVYTLLFTTMPYVKEHINAYQDLKRRMYNDFYDFGRSLEDLNSSISRISVLENHLNKGEEYLTDGVRRDFQSSAFNAESLKRTGYFHDYIFMYSGVNTVIDHILSDEKVSVEEKRYLETLFEYNNQLIEKYKDIMGVLYHENWNQEKWVEVKDNIVNIYNDFSLEADTLLNTSKYGFLNEYKGSFGYSREDFQNIKDYCNQVFSILVPDQTLEYDNGNQVNADKYEFMTYDEKSLVRKSSVHDLDKVDYRMGFHKKTQEITMMAVSWSVSPKTPKYSEDDLDNIVDDLVKKFSPEAINYDKNVAEDRIEYSYISKSNDVYDEMTKIHVTILSHGLITNFNMAYPYHRKIPLLKVKEDDILREINKEADIIDIFKVRTLNNTMEYEVHLKYHGKPYAAVFDGENGNLKYFSQSLRMYNQTVQK